MAPPDFNAVLGKQLAISEQALAAVRALHKATPFTAKEKIRAAFRQERQRLQGGASARASDEHAYQA